LSLNSSMEVLARTVGPAIGGVLIVTIGVPWCFAFNAISFGAVISSLFLMDRSKLRAEQLLTHEPGQLRAGFSYAWSNRRIRRTLMMSTVVFLFAWNWQIIVPLYASRDLDGSASVYGLLVGLLGVGAFTGTLIVARLHRISGRFFRVVCGALTCALTLAAIAPGVAVAVAGLMLLGAAGTAFQIGAQTRLQLESDDLMIGRILAIYAVTSVGAKPLSGLLAGAIMDAFSPRAAFAVGAVAMAILTLALSASRAARAWSTPTTMTAPPLAEDDVSAGQSL
jgi:MFS family permease